jgi:hypothetical protein
MDHQKEAAPKPEMGASTYQEKKGDLIPLNAAEEALLTKWQEKWKEIHPLFCLKQRGDGIEFSVHGSRGAEEEKSLLMRAAACESIGTPDFAFALSLIQQYVNVVLAENHADKIVEASNLYIKAMHNFQPQDEIESMLLTQFLSLQDLGMKCMARAANPASSTINVDRNVNNLNKILRLQHETLESLNRYRRKGTQQVVVQHVQVNQGGQAIVGAIQQDGGGVCGKNGGSTP